MKMIKAREFNQNASRYAREVLETGEPVSVAFRGSQKRVMLIQQPESDLEALIAAGRARPASGERLDEVSILPGKGAQDADMGQAVLDMRDQEDS